MFVLKRQKNESIIIDESIMLVVLEIQNDVVRMGVSCPNDIPVYYQESPPSGEIKSFRSYGGEASEITVYSRKKDELLCIGNDITIAVVLIQANNVRLGIESPRDVVIRRDED